MEVSRSMWVLLVGPSPRCGIYLRIPAEAMDGTSVGGGASKRGWWALTSSPVVSSCRVVYRKDCALSDRLKWE